MYAAQTGGLLWEFAPETDWMQATFHPSGAFVVAAYGHSQAAVVDANTGKILRELPLTGPLVYRIAASPEEFNSARAAALLTDEVDALCAELRQEALVMVAAFDIPDHIIRAPIGLADSEAAMRTYLHAVGFGDDKRQNEEQEEQGGVCAVDVSLSTTDVKGFYN